MEFEEITISSGIRSQNEVFFLESKCVFYSFSILAQSIEELVEL